MLVTKYRYKVLTGEVAVWVRELVRQTCEAFEIRIVKGVVSGDHVEHHVEPNPNDNFKMEPEETHRLGDAYPDFQSVTLNPSALP